MVQLFPLNIPWPVHLDPVASPRFTFQRSATNGGNVLDSTIALTEPALRGVSLNQIPSSYRDRLLLSDDIYADTRVPSLYGLERNRIGYLGANLTGIQAYYAVPLPSGNMTSYDSLALENVLGDSTYLEQSTDTDTANAMLIDYVLGSTTAKTELSKLNSRSQLNELDALYLGSGDGSYAINGRVWNPRGEQSERWQPGHALDTSQGSWIRYRIKA